MSDTNDAERIAELEAENTELRKVLEALYYEIASRFGSFDDMTSDLRNVMDPAAKALSEADPERELPF